MKKTIVFIFALVLAVSMFAGCSGEAASTDATSSEASTESGFDTTYTKESPEIIELESKNIELVATYNEVANLAVTNGWDADATTLAELNAAKAIIDTFNEIITDPTSADGSNLPDMILAGDELIIELSTNIKDRVSVAFAE